MNDNKQQPDKTDGELEDVSLVTEKTDNRGTHPNSKANLTPFEKGSAVAGS